MADTARAGQQPLPASDRQIKVTDGPRRRERPALFGTIRTKIILPFLVLTLIVTMLGTFVVTRLVAANAQDRLTNQLIESSRAASDNIVAWEAVQLDVLRLVVFTYGVPDALREGRADDLSTALLGLAANQNIYLLLGIDRNGTALTGVRRGATGYETGLFAGQDLRDISAVNRILNGEIDQAGDKYAGFAEIDGVVVLLTVAPVRDSAGEFVGVVGIGTPMETILAETKSSVLADLTLYQPDGTALQTTFVLVGQDVDDALSVDADIIERALVAGETEQEATQLETVTVNERDYQTSFVPLKVRDQTLGVVGVSWPATFVTSLITTNRTGLSVLFGVVAMLVVLTGYVIAAQLTQPIRKLAETAERVSAGDLERQSGVRTADEIGVLGRVFDNMTLRLSRAYRELEREAAFLNAVISSAADGTFVIAPDGRITRRNPAADDLLRDDRRGCLEVLARVVGALQGSDEAREQAQIGERYYDVSGAPVLTDSGERIGMTVTLRDVTQRVREEQQRQTFIMQMSHELFTPLTAIKGYVDLAVMVTGANNPQVAELLRQASEGSATLNRLISQMLDVSSMIRGGFEIRAEPVDLRQAVEDALTPYVQEMIDKHVRLETDLQPMGPYEGDGRRLRWAFSQLIANALEYTVPGGWINIYTATEGDLYVVGVRDTGIGILAEDKPHIFDLFYRGRTYTPDGKMIDERGTGVGLYIVDQVVRAHYGQIEVRSKTGIGTEVVIRLPCLPMPGGDNGHQAADG